MKRRLFKLALFLLLGTIVNVGVAWGCAVRPYPGGLFRSGSWPASDYEWISPQVYETRIWKRAGELRVLQVGYFFTGIQVLPMPKKLNDLEYYDLLPHWSAFETSNVVVLPNAEFFEEQAAGWPLLCLRFDRSISFRIDLSSRYIEVNGMLELPWLDNPWRNEVPYIPIWQYFALNTILYALILWLFALGPFAARRCIRNKRGLCIKCGYDLRGSSGGEVCPECGSTTR